MNWHHTIIKIWKQNQLDVVTVTWAEVVNVGLLLVICYHLLILPSDLHVSKSSIHQ